MILHAMWLSLSKLSWLGSIWLLLATAAVCHASEQVVLDADAQPLRLAASADRVVTDASVSFASFLSAAGQTAKAPEHATPQLSPEKALWIRFTTPPATSDQRWFVRLPSPGLDLATLHSMGPDGTWSHVSAGDSIPVAEWPVPHAFPILPIALSPRGSTQHILRIQSTNGFVAPVEFVNSVRLTADLQTLSLSQGLYLGLMLTVAMSAFAGGVALKEGALVAFGIWVITATLQAAALSGVAGVHLWSKSPWWNDNSPSILSGLAAVTCLMFVAEAALLNERSPALFRAVILISIGGSVMALSLPLLPGTQRLTGSLGLAFVVLSIATACAIWAWRHGDRFIGRILIAMAPLSAMLAWQASVLLQLVPRLDIMQTVFVVVGGITMGATYLLLVLRTRDRRDYERHVTRLPDHDPTTGLANNAVFRIRLEDCIARARRLEYDSLAAVIEFPNLDRLREEFGLEQTTTLLVRLGKRITSMIRNVDTVARSGDARFALVLEGPLSASRRRSFGVKLIANCIIPMAGLPQGMIVKPRVALMLVPAGVRSADEVVSRLHAGLKAAAASDRNLILVNGPDDGSSRLEADSRDSRDSRTSSQVRGGSTWP